MSEITAVENNGRIQEIERQRDEALMRCAILSGQVAFWRAAAEKLQEEKKPKRPAKKKD